jgi:hypothetical protein
LNTQRGLKVQSFDSNVPNHSQKIFPLSVPITMPLFRPLRVFPQVSNTKPSEHPFKKVPRLFQERRSVKIVCSPCNDDRRNDMKKVACVLVALATIAVAAPTVASAESFGFRIGSDRDYYRDRDEFRAPRAEFYEHDRGWHRGWDRDRDRTVIIKRRRHWHD